MRLLRPAVFLLAVAAMCGGAIASAQTAPAASASPSPESLKGPGSDFWFMGGGSFSTIRGSCQTCEDDFPYRHSGGVVANAGYRVTSRITGVLAIDNLTSLDYQEPLGYQALQRSVRAGVRIGL